MPASGCSDVAPAGRRADQFRRAGDQQHDAERLPQASPAGCAIAASVERAEIDGHAISEHADSSMIQTASRMRDSIQIARPRNVTPNTALTASIHAPARGSSRPRCGAEHDQRRAHAERQREQREAAEQRIVLLRDVQHARPPAAASTHGPTINADSAPMIATPVSEPPDCLLLTLAIFDCQELGNCSS